MTWQDCRTHQDYPTHRDCLKMVDYLIPFQGIQEEKETLQEA
jgi:hypothetical protein